MRSRLVHIAERLLHLYCADDRLEEVEGDLWELYESRQLKSNRWAALRFLWDVIRSFNWTNIKRPQLLTNQLSMLTNYIKIGYRNLLRDYKFTLINLVGLSLGLCVFIVMMMMVRHELTFDHFHSKGDRIFQVIQEFENTEGSDPEIFTALPLADALREDLSMVENAVTVHGAASTWMEVGDKLFFEEDGIVAGREFFQFFDYTFLEGSKVSALSKSRSIVIDQPMATKIFDTANPIGKVIDVERYGLFTVTGVIDKVPSNSFMQFDFVISQDYEKFFEFVHPRFPAWFQSWQGDPAATFVLLNDPSMAGAFPEQANDLLLKHLEPSEVNPHQLINLRDLHFGLTDVEGQINEYVRGDMSQLRLLMIISGMVLFMACFNFVNLLTARSVSRSKEVGIRKSIGAARVQIFVQFMTEAFLQVCLSFMLALGLIYLVLPYFIRMTGISMDIDQQLISALAPMILLVLLLVTFFAGVYPSFFLSSVSAINALKGHRSQGNQNFSVRNVLMVLQYAIVVLIISTLIIVDDQFRFMKNKPLGFDASHLLVVEVNGGGVRNNFESLKNDLLSSPKISAVTGLTRMISGHRSSVGVYAKDMDDPDRQLPTHFYGMDSDGPSALGLQVLVGSDFQGIKTLDSTSVLLNETAAEWYGGERIVGEWIELQGDEGENVLRAKVTGIVKDFHYSSLHESIGPVVLGHLDNPFQSIDDIVIRLSPDELTKTLAYVEDVHNRYDENDVMTWEFLDDMLQRSYEKELIIRDIFLGAALIAFLIALIGLIGLISYNVTIRTKELGIRKVMGAEYLQLLLLQGRSFVRYLAIAFLIASPLAWWIGFQWLENYAYRIDLGPLPFVLSLTLVLLATATTIWIINHRSIRRNPVESLRYE